MNSPILPVDGPSGLSSSTPPSTNHADDVGAFIAELAVGNSVLAIDAARGGPSQEVLDQIAGAAAIEERLRASGRQLRFVDGPAGERTTIEAGDGEGGVARTLSVTEAVEISTGKSLG